MLKALFDLAPRALRLLAPEEAHELTLKALELGAYPNASPDPPMLATSFAGLTLRNPIGIAAGFDKDARVPMQFCDLAAASLRSNRHSAAPTWQREAARIQAVGRSRGHQSSRLQQRRTRCRPGASAAQAAPRCRRCEHWRQQGCIRSHR